LIAIHAFNMLANGMGGCDWAGLPYVVAYLGVQDVEGLLDRLRVIKLHRPPKPGEVNG
jgi:hypothetical protein